MKFDAVMIGGGLAGLLCGIQLAEAGMRCALVSRGQSALHFSSGSLDLLSTLPDGAKIDDIDAGLRALAEQAPQHPYSLIGAAAVMRYADQAEALLTHCGLALRGSWRAAHYRVTPFGKLRAAWLSPMETPVAPLRWQRVMVVGIAGFMDFQPQLVAASLAKQGIQVKTAELTLDALVLLKRIPGLELVELESQCCGIAGTYGFKQENYATSQAIGAPLFRQIAQSGVDLVITDCETCKWQIEMSAGVACEHPISLLARALA